MMNLEDLTRRRIAYLMTVLTLVVPFGVFWQGGSERGAETAIYSMIWVLRLQNGEFYAVHAFDLAYTLTAATTGIFSILFAIQVVRCFKGEASRRLAYIIGVLTMLFPVALGVPMMLYTLDMHSIFLYMGPVPIQLVVGIVLILKTEPVIISGPWKDEGKEV
ncbi:MAG: hypothetical protein P1Q69_00640 [Candidatus Thorarchaeota archaeon]|nr:hypothetical protein [Candidatus Thorarchaeota archaeon]